MASEYKYEKIATVYVRRGKVRRKKVEKMQSCEKADACAVDKKANKKRVVEQKAEPVAQSSEALKATPQCQQSTAYRVLDGLEKAAKIIAAISGVILGKPERDPKKAKKKQKKQKQYYKINKKTGMLVMKKEKKAKKAKKEKALKRA